MRGGRPLSRGYIYKLLGNPLYAGRIAHKGEVYAGLHKAVIDAETWEAVAGGRSVVVTTSASSRAAAIRVFWTVTRTSPTLSAIMIVATSPNAARWRATSFRN